MSPVFEPCIRGLGSFVPEKILTNADLEKMVDTTDEWIMTRTGIRERRIAQKGTPSSDLALAAAGAALKNANLSPADLDLIIVATITPDMFFPSTGCVLQHKLGGTCPAFDMAAACAGFPYGLATAEAYIRSGIYRNVLVVGAEVLSGFIDWKDRSTCVLFGDGAGAAVVSGLGYGEKGHRIIASHLGADGAQGDILRIPAGGSLNPPTLETVRDGMHFLKMEGSEVFKTAVKTMAAAVHSVLAAAGLGIGQVDWLVPHQANQRILKAVAERLEMPLGKVIVNVDRYGNMSSASTAVALHEAVSDGRIGAGDRVVLVAFGGGLTWASSLIEW